MSVSAPFSSKDYLRLRANLCEMAHVKENFTEEMVSYGSSVYHKEGFNKFSIKKSPSDINSTLELIKNIFCLRIIFLRNACSTYFENWGKKIADRSYHFSQNELAEKNLLKFCQYLNPVIKDFIRNVPLPYLDYLPHGVKKKEVRDVCCLAKLVQKIKDSEITTKQKFPFRILYKLSTSKQLKAKETDKIKTWLNLILKTESVSIRSFGEKKKNPFIQVRFFHRFLWDMVDAFNELPLKGKNRSTILALEMNLIALNCLIFNQPDPRALKERSELSGKWIITKEKAYEVGEILVNPSNKADFPQIYALANDPAYQLVAQKNEACQAIQHFTEMNDHFGIILPKVLWVDRTGAYSIVEKCSFSLDQIKWKSQSSKIHADDLIEAQGVIDLLFGLSQMPCTPYPLTPKDFAYNHNNEMRALRVMRIGLGKSFESLFKFAWELSKNPEGSVNSCILAHLMKESGLRKSPRAKLYREVVSQALKNKNSKKITTWDGRIKDKQIRYFRSQLLHATQKIQNELIKLVQQNYEEASEDEISNTIMACHSKYSSGPYLPPDFLELCQIHLLSQSRPLLKKEFYLPLYNQLAQEIAQMDLGNPSIVEVLESEDFYYKQGIFHAEQQKQIFNGGIARFALK